MNAVVFHGIGDIRLENVKDPALKQAGDAIVKLTASAICGTDLHMVRGTLGQMERGTILGHDGYVSYREGDEQKPDDSDRQLQSPKIRSQTGGVNSGGVYRSLGNSN